MSSEPIFLGLGTNLGDRQANLQMARSDLYPDITILQSSGIYETLPWGFTDQPAFLNQVLEICTQLEPLALLKRLKAIEVQMGRMKTFRYGPRLIDLDILFYGDRILDSETLTIPHPHLHERAFVLVPLNEIAPDFLHPILSKTVAALLKDVETREVRRL